MSDHIKRVVRMTVRIDIDDGELTLNHTQAITKEMLNQCQSRTVALREVLHRMSDGLVTKTVEYDNRGDKDFKPKPL